MKTHIPKFKSLEEEQRFWDTHSISDFEEDLKPAPHVKFIQPKKKLVSIRLDVDQIDSIRHIAHRKGLGYLTLLRHWITQHIGKEN